MHIEFDGFILIFVVLINTLFGLAILLRNTHSKINALYACMVFAVVSWAITNFATNHVGSHGAQLVTNRLSFITGYLLMLTVWALSLYFPRKLPHSRPQLKIAVALVPITIVLCLTSLVIKDVAYLADKQVTNISAGPLYFFYVASVLCFLILIIRNFRGSIKVSRGVEHQQAVYSTAGIILTFLWILLTTAVIPALTGQWTISKIGSLGSVLLVGMTGYAIVKHRLFDIRLIVARSIAYVGSLAVVASLFGFLVFGISDIVFNLHFTMKVQVFISAATAVASLSFAKAKQFFDRTTNKLFFRDSYDTQVFFDKFNKALVVTYDLDQLLKESIKIIGEDIKPTHCQFIVNETATTEGRIMGTPNKPALTEQDVRAIEEAIGKTRHKLVITDELETQHEALQKRLRAKDIVLAAALSSSSSGKTEVGYLLLGPKKSGNLYSSQDVKVLEIVANELVIAVQNALRFEEIENFNLTLQAKVDEATRKLRKANERLKTMDETKDDFISMASHQLRTPLTSVKGYISMVLEEDAGKITPKQREMLGQAFFSSQRMVYLIADLLNISRLKTGKFIIESTPVNLADVVEQELGQLKETAAARSLALKYDKPKDFPVLMLDETKTRQVIMNFADNAIYYTPPGGNITVRLVDNPSTIELRVEDDGIGVPKTERPHLFTKFYRAGNARKARPDGTGLGLFMAKKVIAGQGGSIIFESQEGKGSTFGFVFSKAKHAVPTGSSTKPPLTAVGKK